MKKRLSLKALLSSVILGIIIVVVFISIFYNADNISYNNGAILFSFLLNGVIIFLILLQPSKSTYRLADVVNVFMFIFMFVAPLVQYMSNKFPWWNTNLITDEVVIVTNLIILSFVILFNLIYFITKTDNKIKEHPNNNYIKYINIVLDILWILTIVTGLFIISKVGITNLFSRSTNTLNINNQSIWLIINYSVRSIPVFYIGLSLLYYQKNKVFYKPLKFILGLIMMLLVNFPTGLPRFWIGSVYIGLIVILSKKFTKPNQFKILLLFGLIIIFPIINSFRRVEFIEVFKRGIELAPLSEYFLSGDFDAYSMLARSIVITNQIGFSWGNQLLGSILFFIPRAVWPTKPLGSGYTIGTLLGWSFVNVSMPLIGEGYINFGAFGVVILAIFLGVVLKKMDFNYNNYGEKGEEIFYIEIVFPFTLGFLFFILRGDLLSSWAYYIGFMIPVIILYIINQFVKFHN